MSSVKKISKMGWKSTIYLKRCDVIASIHKVLENKTNEELSDIMENIGLGDDTDLPYFGHNFIINDDGSEPDDYDYR